VLLHGRRRSVRPRFSASRVHGIFRTSGEIVPDRIPIQKLRKKLREMGGTAPVFAAFKRFSTLDERLGVSHRETPETKRGRLMTTRRE